MKIKFLLPILNRVKNPTFIISLSKIVLKLLLYIFGWKIAIFGLVVSSFQFVVFWVSSPGSSSITIIQDENEDPLEEDSVNNLPLNLSPPFNPVNNLPLNPPFNLGIDPVARFRSENPDEEDMLFNRIRLLENRYLEGLPPQLDLKSNQYENLVRDSLNESGTISIYQTLLQNELFEISILEMKADLVERLAQLVSSESSARFIQIMTESLFPESAITTQALEFIGNCQNELNLDHPRAWSPEEKNALRDFLTWYLINVQQNGHQSEFYLRFLNHLRGG